MRDPALVLSPEAASEVAAALRTIPNWEMKGDRLSEAGLDLGGQPTGVTDLSGMGSGPGYVAANLAQWWATSPTHDRAVVILTEQPESWDKVVPITGTSVLDEPISRRPPVQRIYILDPASSGVAMLSLPGPDPTFVTYTAARGSLAQALASCWINAIGARRRDELDGGDGPYATKRVSNNSTT